ncbi:MAG: PepSY domain-containing protein [Burkholderiales bacterium]|nr:PepSY domain-containing protein [Burkholderiales bacterium]
MRAIWVVVHRWCGLATAMFLFVAGLTGAIISWDHEIDEWLNSHLFETTSRGAVKSPLDLARSIEATDPRVRVTFVPLQHEEGHALIFGVQPRVNPATGRLFDPGYNQVFVDSVTGETLGRREWGKVALDREHLMSFLYKLHYSLHIPEMGGIDRWGIWFMGVIGVVWLLDCFLALLISFPNPRAWAKSFAVRWRAGGYRLNFDLHRAGALWTWLLLFVLALTAVSLNLSRELFQPLLATFSTLTPTPFTTRAPSPLHRPIAPQLPFERAIGIAESEAARRNWQEPIGAISYSQRYGIYIARFHEPGNDHGSGGMGVKGIYIDGADGRTLGDRVPWDGTAADVFVQLQFPLHSGRIAGIPGRILISLMGIIVAMLSVTGVVIWARKRRARRVREAISGRDNSGTAVATS